jgi:prophage tail gpP-like protein
MTAKNIAPDQETLTISTGGKTLSGWLEVSITRGVEICPSSFSVSMTERFPGQAAKAVVDPGSPCTIAISGTTILTGYVDAFLPGYDADSHTVHLLGRSKTEDIVDCSVDADAVGWEIYGGNGAAVKTIASKICAPFGVNVVMPDGDSALPTGAAFSVYPGFRCFQLIEELCRSVGMLAWDDANGNLVISKAGTAGRAASSLVEGQNILAAEAMFTMNERFNTYKVVSQVPNDITGHISTYAFANPQDNGVPRYRLMLIPSETPLQKQFLQRRANWERSRRYGRSRMARITVPSWRDSAGNIWQPNSVIGVNAPNLKIVEDRVISEVTFYRGERGTLATLTLIEKQGLTPEPFFAIGALGTTTGNSVAGTIST